MNRDDSFFWERLAEMPFEEAEQECVLRREHIALRIAMLRGEKVEAEARKEKTEAHRIGVAMFEDGAQLTMLNERIKYLRRAMDSINWREGIKTVLGYEAYEQVVAWRIREQESLMPIYTTPST